MTNFKKVFTILFIFIVISSSLYGDIDYKKELENKIINYKNKIPSAFSCTLESKSFTEYLNDLGEDAFIDNPEVKLIYKENETSKINVTNVNDGYESFVDIYFDTLEESYLLVLLYSNEEIKSMLSNYDVKFIEGAYFLTNENGEKIVIKCENDLIISFKYFILGDLSLSVDFSYQKKGKYIFPKKVDLKYEDEDNLVISFLKFDY